MACEPQKQCQAVRRILVVVHDEDPAPQGAVRLRLIARGLGRTADFGRSWQIDAEFAASPGACAVRFDAASVQLRQSPSQGETDPEAALGAGACRLHLREHLEEPGERLRSEPDSGISHRDDRKVSLSFRAQGNLTAGVGVLARVGQQVGDDLGEA